MLTFYHAPRSRSFRILWLLEELGIPYETKLVPIRRGDGSGEEAEAAYRKIHPHAKVPAISHDGVAVFETPAIALYLTDAFPEAGLGPCVGEPLRGPYLSWLAYSTGVIEPAILAKLLNIPHRYGTFGWGPPEEVEAVLAQKLEAGPYLLGEKFSAADIVIGGSFPLLLQAKFLFPIPAFTAYAERLTARPAHARAQAKDGR
jgi:glutathione S-transferase